MNKIVQLKTVHHHILFEGRFNNIKSCLEAAIAQDVSLQGIYLYNEDLRNANLDGGNFGNARIYNCDMRGANLSECNFDLTRFQMTILSDACLAEAKLTRCIFDSVTFSSETIFTDADLACSNFNCPTIFNANLSKVRNLNNCIYSHFGKTTCKISQVPIVISNLHLPVILMDHHLKIGPEVHTYEEWCGISAQDIDHKYGNGSRELLQQHLVTGLYLSRSLGRLISTESKCAV